MEMNPNMKILIYKHSNEEEAPFEELYRSSNGDSQLLISNHANHVNNFLSQRERIIDEAIGKDITKKEILVPVEIEWILLVWVFQTWGIVWKEVNDFNTQSFKQAGANRINAFIETMEIKRGWQQASFSDNLPIWINFDGRIEEKTFQKQDILYLLITTSQNQKFSFPTNMQNTLLEWIKEILSWINDKLKTDLSIKKVQNKDVSTTDSPITSFEIGDNMAAKDDLIKLFTEIAEKDNEVDAVFITSTGDAQEPVLVSGKREEADDRHVEVSRFGGQIKHFTEFLGKGAAANVGELEYATLQFSKGVTSITLLGTGDQKYYLFFVSTTADGIGEFEAERRFYLPRIVELLKKWEKIPDNYNFKKRW